MTHHHTTYPPLNTLKPVADELWIVDGPEIRFGMPGLKMPFPTRMTVIRLPGQRLFIHSPTPLTEGLVREIAGIGEPAFIIGPNRIHYWWIPDWRAAFPGAQVWLAPRIAEQSNGRIDFPARILTERGGYAWDAEIETLPIGGRFMTYPRDTLSDAVRTMIGWEPERVIVAHGRWYEADGSAELRRAFRWLLD